MKMTVWYIPSNDYKIRLKRKQLNEKPQLDALIIGLIFDMGNSVFDKKHRLYNILSPL